MNSADLIKLLKSKGFTAVNVRGSHHKLRNAANITLIIPHPKKDLGKGLVAAILKQAGLQGLVRARAGAITRTPTKE